ncbi:MAG: sulfurtransferase TusA family protein [Candidatus Bathyarchaeia archaeon]|nr:sulfurtransferase TusA family protein [Candidatus Bathyarchaeota archaeon]
MAEDGKVVVVDARFKSCPGPLIAASEAAKRAEPGQVMRILVTDPAAPSDIREWALEVGHKPLKISEREGVYEIEIEIR